LLYWITRIPHFLAHNLRRLPASSGLPSRSRVSLVIAARDEGPHIAATVKSFASQNYPDLEIIIVNDRSTDQTGRILDELALEEPRLKVVHNTELPSGWLGKCWSLHQGTRLASGDWLLFSDGDVLLEKQTLMRAVMRCEQDGYDHICIAPRIISASFIQEAVTQSLAMLFFLFQNPRAINAPNRPSAYMGVGAFNMVRRSNYEAFGGHVPLRLEVVDDVFLGMLVKRFGGRSAFFLGPDAGHIHWYAGLLAYIRGLEKNAFAGLRFSIPLLIIAVLGQILIFFAPLVIVIFGNSMESLLGLFSLLIAHGLFVSTCVRQESSAYHGILLLPAIILQFYTFIRSAFVISRKKGVTWRDTFYELQDLKDAQRRLRGPLIPKR
ncbi:MAG: glycosyltransferase, partial [Chitinophagaceae bacterium]|nr:glycosyltransferase [Oligoflexus sp.]